VHAIDLVDGEAFHQPVIDHGFPSRAAFLGRLEDYNRLSGEIARLGKMPCCSEKHGRVTIMPAGMHLSRDARSPWQSGLLRYRQGIHIGAQADCIARSSTIAVDDANDARTPDSFHDLVAAERTKEVGNFRSRILDIIEQFRLCMEIPPPCRDVFLKFGHSVDDRHHCSLKIGAAVRSVPLQEDHDPLWF
jgi:hypothetical protein